MVRPPGRPGIDWDLRTGKLRPGKTTVICDGCGKEKIGDDIVVDDADGANLCATCAIDRVEKQIPPGQYKKGLLGLALGKIRNGRT